MIVKMFYGACAIALVTTTAVIAQPSGSDSSGNENKQICRSTADTGSRLGRSRECHTAQEWAEIRRQTQQNIDRIQNARTANGN